MASATERIEISAEGFAKCPDCGTTINCGTGGIQNLNKRHRGGKACREAKARRDRDAKKMKDGSLLSFLKPKAIPVPSTVQDAGPAMIFPNTASRQSLASPSHGGRESDPGPALGVKKTGNGFIERLEKIVQNLPDTVPIGSANDKLAAFSIEPATLDNPNVDAEDLWEVVLNRFLKEHLGWGEETDMHQLIRRGGSGLDGVLRFSKYFIERRGVSVDLFEGKLANLLGAAEALITHQIPKPQAAAASFGDIHQPGSLPRPEGNPHEVIDVDSLATDSPGTGARQPRLSPRCSGYLLEFPRGQSPHTDYPFGLHDSGSLSWDYSVRNGVMILHARSCDGLAKEDAQSCKPCQNLQNNAQLKGIRTRMEEGVHENATFAYHSFNGLIEIVRRKSKTLEFVRLRGLNQARKLLVKAGELSEYKRFTLAISSGEVERVDRVIAQGLKQKKGIRGIMASLEAAAQGIYHPKNFTEEEAMRALLAWRLGGNRLAHINHRSRGDPSLTYLRRISFTPPIIPSHAQPTTLEVSENVSATFSNVLDIIQARIPILHTVVAFDELATEKRVRWDPKTNFFLGICREHGHRTSLEFNNEGDMEEVFRCLDDGEIHYAGEATIAALGVLTNDHRVYPARPVLASGDCKRESGIEHAKLIQTVIDGINAQRATTKLRIVSIASDGESRRGSAFAFLTFQKKLSRQSPIYPLLSPLIFMDFHVGEDDITCDKDWKHIFKRFRNLLLRPRGVAVDGFRIRPDIIRDHFRSVGLTVDHIDSLMNPKDQQDVKMAFDMLKAIWNLPRETTNMKPGFQRAREALCVLGKLLFHLTYPFLCVDLDLSEQLEHLSAAAHLALTLYSQAGKEFIPSELFIDIMIMIKNVYFCVAKCKIDDPEGSFWIILLGTDRLEELFGILRTMVGNDANLDFLQLVSRITGTTEVSNILAKYPQWDRAPRRLKLPALTRDTKELPDTSDHIKPGSWRGNVRVKLVSLQTSWRRGRHLAQNDCGFIIPILDTLEKAGADILSPKGTLLVNSPLPVDDVDESLDAFLFREARSLDTDDSSQSLPGNRVDVENALVEAALEDANLVQSSQQPFDRKVLINGKEMAKSRALAQYSKYRKQVGSTDRLKRVQGIERYSATTVSNHHYLNNPLSPDVPVLMVSDPIATLLCCDNRAWLCIGEVNGLKVDGQYAEFVPHGILHEKTVTVSYQVLGVRPATLDDDPSALSDWRSCRIEEMSFTVPGQLIQPINPAVSTQTPHAFYLLDSQFLIAMAASLLEFLSASDLKNIPKVPVSHTFPYREASGKACFLCEDEKTLLDFGYLNVYECALCSPAVVLDLSQNQRILEHVAAHILHDPKVERITEPCGLCLRPAPLCQFFLKKGKGANGSLKIGKHTGCSIKPAFSYGVASESSVSSPCSNVPIMCPLCPAKDSPAIWKYNMKYHFRNTHKTVALDTYEHLWELSNFEIMEMKKIWGKRHNVPVKRPKKTKAPPLIVSDIHRSRIPSQAASANIEDSGHESVAAVESDEASEDEPSEAEVDHVRGDAGESAQSPDPEINGEVNDNVSDSDTDPFADMLDRVPMADEDYQMYEPTNLSPLDEVTTGNPTQPVTAATISGTNTIPDSEAGPSMQLGNKRKRKVQAIQETHSGVDHCLCGVHATPNSNDAAKCKRNGCETKWYHLECIQLEQVPKNWVCDACSSSQRGRGGKHARR